VAKVSRSSFPVAASVAALNNQLSLKKINRNTNMESGSNNNSANANAEEENPYLAMRRAKIARNQERLRTLGLLKPSEMMMKKPQSKKSPEEQSSTVPPTTATTAAPVARGASAYKPRRSRGREKATGLMLFAPARRSSRISSRQPATTPGAAPMIRVSMMAKQKPSLNRVNRKRALSPDGALAEEDATASSAPIIAKSVSSSSAKSSPSIPAANSVRTVDLDIKTLVLGNNNNNTNNNGLLGKMMERTGKEFIINESFSLAASIEDQQRLQSVKLSFNKYCGVQEWKNALFLWVNLGTNDSPNEFLEDARCVTWFGGSRMHDDSPVVQKLIRYGKEGMGAATKQEKQEEEGAIIDSAGSAGTDSSSNIILWCRRYQPEEKKFSPYVCFGRLGYRSHVPGSRPLSFVWELLDYDGLKHHGDDTVRETFDTFTKM